MRRLTDEMLIEVYVKAKQLRLEETFIAIVEKEIVRRGLNVKPAQGAEQTIQPGKR